MPCNPMQKKLIEDMLRQRYVYTTIKMKENCSAAAATGRSLLISSDKNGQNESSHSLDQTNLRIPALRMLLTTPWDFVCISKSLTE